MSFFAQVNFSPQRYTQNDCCVCKHAMLRRNTAQIARYFCLYSANKGL